MNNHHLLGITFLFLFLNQILVSAQGYSLEDLLGFNDLTRDAQIAETQKTINEFDNRLFAIQVFPKVQLSATLPGLTNSISPITLGDGSEIFANRFYMTSSISMGLSQLIPFTGGTLYLSSGLTRLDNFAPNRTTSFSLKMINLSYTQSISSYNQYTWEKKTLKKQNELFSVSQIQSREEINLMIVELFFDLLAAQKQEELNILMENNAHILCKKAEALFSVGRISQADYLDAVIGLNQFRKSTVQIDRLRQQSKLVSKLHLSEESPVVVFDFDVLDKIEFKYRIESVIDRVVKYSASLPRELELIGEGSTIKKTKTLGLPSITISVGGGVNSSDEEFRRLASSSAGNFSATVSIGIPILSWGENRVRVKRLEAQSAISALKYSNTVDDLISTSQYELECLPLLLESVIISKETLDVLYTQIQELSNQFEFGRISYTRINDLQKEIIQTELTRIARVKQLYSIIYKYRYLALFDLCNNLPLFEQ